ncbi:phosphotransferase [Streptomyces sp. AV19]|uniref:phosphotransferase enzyme family protein n=1 Tax=Streptomyces sp. AV19 TaxID=2793068 RepID=UPI0018FEED9B|nr:phosphotransferase [Streptomyces sp. AV19]MBH1936047.1 phosphotransferase [Streptomyces sp. AV19]MDG4534160.1 phosphotransferase [Streptomyces sp. AV19]
MLSLLHAWGEVDVVGRLGGGHRNEVLELRRKGERLVARRTRRGSAALDWELDLLVFLGHHGFSVPTVVPCLDGRRHLHGVVVQRWMEGRPPVQGDWARVAAELSRMHALTKGWPQRPGFCSSTELLFREHGGDVDLSAMPEAAVDACRRAWRGMADVPQAVVHGDPGVGNIRVTEEGVGFLDWDEARVDHVDLDLADLPDPGLPPDRLRVAQAAVNAWEAACSWSIEPAYARRRLAAITSSQRTSSIVPYPK